ncbi:hypothetical protein HWC35_gp136 [Vibrio phage USC-1]|uniref:Uncharacterized protein n=1 Tax=Vibrio phage USC-1 TaxID=2592615 RepID=A0A514A2L9_9CAUD|nr:hypothetical protein HWC35_gp136 [Vibrio phage USC-1]QDH47530.1 hypothetical protein [Vibrio phage USC-1]
MSFLNSSNETKVVSVDLSQVNQLVYDLMFDNDLRSIPTERIADVKAGLIYQTLRDICSDSKFKLCVAPSEPSKYEVIYFQNKLQDRVDFEIHLTSLEYETTLLHRYYSAGVLEDILTDIGYAFYQILYSMTPNTRFEHEVQLALPNIGHLIVSVHKDDLRECNADDISDTTISGLYTEALLDRFHGDDSS